MIKQLLKKLVRRYTYPWSDGTARRQDPTYGKVDRDIQWQVWDAYPDIPISQRIAIELTFQNRRDQGWVHIGYIGEDGVNR